METIITWIQSSLSFIVPMTVLLGFLIFVHELGHFLVAKYYKVRVEVFSLGFGPKIFKFKRGDTTYCISAVPLGGYVKMFGDDPTAEIQDDQRAVAFTHKPVGQRIAIVLAGPLMNFFFALFLFMGVALIGEQALSPEIGDIENKSLAYNVGFRPGDMITAINNEPVKTWDDVQKIIESSAEETTRFSVQRPNESSPVEIAATPKKVANRNVLSWAETVGEIEGLNYLSRASVIAVTGPDTVAAKSGFRTGDFITEVEGVTLERWRDLIPALQTHAAEKSEIKVKVSRGDFDGKEPKKLELVLTVPASAQPRTTETLLADLGFEYPEMYLAKMEKDSPALAAGLTMGDKIVAINGQKLSSFQEVATIIQNYGKPTGAETDPKNAPAPLQISILRDGQLQEVAVTPKQKDRMNNQGKEERLYQIGIAALIVNASPTTTIIKASGVVDAIVRGASQTWKWTSLTVLSFVRLFQAEVSAKNIGGFLSIGQMAKKSWQIGLAPFLNVMALISVNLFIVNLLPVPVLDGGHLVFYSIEAIRGAPLSMRKLEIAQQVGIILLIGLMVFALFNDFSRLFGGPG